MGDAELVHQRNDEAHGRIERIVAVRRRPGEAEARQVEGDDAPLTP